MNFSELEQVIEFSDIISPKQKMLLKVICNRSYSIAAKELEETLNLSRPLINFHLSVLLNRGFIIREKENVFLYRFNPDRIEELKCRYYEKKKHT